MMDMCCGDEVEGGSLLFLQSFWAFLATFMYLLTSNHQISETERYSVYHVFRNIKLDMSMKKFGIWAVAAALFFAPMGLSSCSMGSSASEMKGSLNFTQDDLTEKPFKAIDVDVIADVYYTQNDGNECSVKMDYSAIKDQEFVKKLKEKLKVVYRDGEVKIGLNGRLNVPSSCNGDNKRLKIYITSPDLVKITREGVGSFRAKTINSDRLEIDNEGVDAVKIGKILANKLEITNEGVGSVNIDDVAGDDMNIDNEGVGSVKISKIEMGSVKLDNEGVGSVNLGMFKGGSLIIKNEGVGSVKAKVDCQSVNATSEGVGGVNLSGVTRQYNKKKGGIGGISDGGLTVRE